MICGSGIYDPGGGEFGLVGCCEGGVGTGGGAEGVGGGARDEGEGVGVEFAAWFAGVSVESRWFV